MSGFCFHLMAGMYGTSTSINWILMGKWHLQRTHEFYDKMSYKSIQITPTHNWANIPRKKACRVSKHPKIILSYSTYIIVCFSKKEGKLVAWWIGAGARIGEAWARSNELWSCWFILLARVFLSPVIEAMYPDQPGRVFGNVMCGEHQNMIFCLQEVFNFLRFSRCWVPVPRQNLSWFSNPEKSQSE